MINRELFFSVVRPRLFNNAMTQSQVDGINSILDAWESGYATYDRRWLAYALATTQHETGATMQPIEEWGKGKGHKYGQRFKMSGAPYTDTENIFYGRGDVQLTWYENYEKAGQKLGRGRDFINSPELVMVPEIAAEIMFKGMIEGWFTGKKFADYIRNGTCDYLNSRRIINGTDKAALIAEYAYVYQEAMPDFSDVVAGSSTTGGIA